MRVLSPKLAVGPVSQTAGFVGIFVEIGELLPILAQGDVVELLVGTRPDTPKSLADIGNPAPFLRIFPFIDEIQTDFSLKLDNGADAVAQGVVVIGVGAVDRSERRKAPDMRGQIGRRASPHNFRPMFGDRSLRPTGIEPLRN